MIGTSGLNFICPKCSSVLLHVDENERISTDQLQILSKLKICPECRYELSLGGLLRTTKGQELSSFTLDNPF
ncbi:MAG TPA: hypothetical protein VEH56_06370 [Candidatus Saccharimonadales bacterium]|nr:hypothetical protein [Candidatus Saccharimonadales bacterium]